MVDSEVFVIDGFYSAQTRKASAINTGKLLPLPLTAIAREKMFLATVRVHCTSVCFTKKSGPTCFSWRLAGDKKTRSYTAEEVFISPRLEERKQGDGFSSPEQLANELLRNLRAHEQIATDVGARHALSVLGLSHDMPLTLDQFKVWRPAFRLTEMKQKVGRRLGRRPAT